MEKKFFSIITWQDRFGYAFRGLIDFFHTEHNAWVHLLSTIALAILAGIKGVSKNELLALIAVTGFVWVTELLNTALEKLADLVSIKYHPQIKTVKDMAAAAVLIAACTALATGLLIFIPKFIK